MDSSPNPSRPRRRPRPFPSSPALAALLNSQRPQQQHQQLPPILVNFFRALGKEPPSSTTASEQPDDVDQLLATNDPQNAEGVARTGQRKRSAQDLERSNVVLGASQDELEDVDAPPPSLDDSSGSLLTDMQHQRFLQLSLLLEERTDKPVSTWREATRKEYYKLVKLVRKEQSLYRQALALYWKNNSHERLSVGFQQTDGDSEGASTDAAEPFNNSALQSKQRQAETWRKWLECGHVPRTYGKCRQVITFDIGDQFAALSLDSIVPLVIHPESHSVEVANASGPSSPATGQERVAPGSCVPPPRRDDSTCFPVELLGDDEKVLALAAQHHADLVTTEEALRSVLQRSADDEKSPVTLLMPVSRSSATSVVLLESPVPIKFASPRECLEVGVDEALRQISKDPASSSSSAPSSNSFTYTLLKIPCRTRHALRVLVRHRQHHRDVSSVRARIEYYYRERGHEMTASIDRALWVTDHLLGGRSTDAAVAICRVDPTQMTCVGWESASWASATTEASRWYEQMDQGSVVEHWRRLASLLSATRTIGTGKHLLVFPGRNDMAASTPLSVTVHESEEGGEIDLMSQLEGCSSLPLGTDEFARCQRYWKWDSERRVPYSFPVSHASKADAPNVY